MAILLATDDVAKLFFDSAGDLAKQLIAVSTGILGLSITFLKDVVKEAPKTPRWPLRFSWILFLLSVICGFWTLMAVTGSIERLLPGQEFASRNPKYTFTCRAADSLVCPGHRLLGGLWNQSSWCVSED